MLTVTFHTAEEIENSLLRFAVIAAQYQGKWILCRHKKRSTWEIPGGHREPGEAIHETAHRELWEKTGASKASLQQVCVYNVRQADVPSYGMLYYAEISETGLLPEGSEIAETALFHTLPENLTYPDIQPHLFRQILSWLNNKTAS